jgi:hypothetical protein
MLDPAKVGADFDAVNNRAALGGALYPALGGFFLRIPRISLRRRKFFSLHP